MKFKSNSVGPVQGKNFLHKTFCQTEVRQHKEFKPCFAFQDPWKPISTRKVYPNCKLYPFMKHILYVFHFEWLLGCTLSVYEQIIGFQGIHVDKMKIS